MEIEFVTDAPVFLGLSAVGSSNRQASRFRSSPHGADRCDFAPAKEAIECCGSFEQVVLADSVLTQVEQAKAAGNM